MAVINKPAQPLIAPTDVEEVEAIAGAAAADAIAADTTHAPLVNDLVPAANLPSYVDDVLEFATLDAFPEEGEEGKIYVARDTNNTYRWADTTYVQVGGSEIDLTPYALQDSVDHEFDIVYDQIAGVQEALNNKQDKPYTLAVQPSGAPQPIDPSDPTKGFIIDGSLTEEQVANVQQHWPNVQLDGLDSVLVDTTSRGSDDVVIGATYQTVQYIYDEHYNVTEASLGTLKFDFEHATFRVIYTPLPINNTEPEGSGVPTITLNTDEVSGTLNAEQLAIVQNNTNVIIDIAAIDETLRGPSTIYRSSYCNSRTMQAIASNPDGAKKLTINRNTGAWEITDLSSLGGTHYLYLEVTINKPSGPGPIVVGSELEVTSFECDNCEPNVWFPYDIGAAPVVTYIDLIVLSDAQSSEGDEKPHPVAQTGFTTLFYPQDFPTDLSDALDSRHISYNSSTGTITLNLAPNLYQYRDESDQLVYGSFEAPILVMPYQEVDAKAHFAAVEQYSVINPILADQLGIARPELICNGKSYSYIGCDGWILTAFDPNSNEILDLIRGEARVDSGIPPILYIENDGTDYWLRPLDEQLDLEDRSWHIGTAAEGLNYCYRIRNINNTPCIDFYYNPTPDIQLHLIFNNDDSLSSEINYPTIHQLTFDGTILCTTELIDSSGDPLSRDIGQIMARPVLRGSGDYALEWEFHGTNGKIIGHYWIDAETGDLKHEIIWDNYHISTTSGGDETEAYVPVRYHRRPTPESEWNPPSDWPTKLSLDEIFQGTVNFFNLISEPDGYGWQVLNIVGYCEYDEVGTLMDAWGPIIVNVSYNSRPK